MANKNYWSLEMRYNEAQLYVFRNVKCKKYDNMHLIIQIRFKVTPDGNALCKLYNTPAVLIRASSVVFVYCAI